MSTVGFETFGASHLTAMATTLAVPVVLSVIAASPRSARPASRRTICPFTSAAWRLC